MNSNRREPLDHVTDDPELIRDRLLGTFRKTGVRRVPQIGEYYLADRVLAVCLCTTARSSAKEILRPVKDSASTE